MISLAPYRCATCPRRYRRPLQDGRCSKCRAADPERGYRGPGVRHKEIKQYERFKAPRVAALAERAARGEPLFLEPLDVFDDALIAAAVPPAEDDEAELADEAD